MEKDITPKELEDQQNELCDVGVVALIVTLVNINSDALVFLECIRLGIAVLENGNEKLQQAFLEEFNTERGETFLGALHAHIQQSLEDLKAGYAETTLTGSAHSKLTNHATIQAILRFLMKIQAIHRFLQLLCENHNIRLQEYIHKQSIGPMGSSGNLVNDVLIILLFDLVFREDTLKNVIRSVTRNGVSILLTALLGLIVIYLFSIVGYVYLRDDFTIQTANGEEEWCDSLLMCIVTTMNNGLRNGGGIGDVLRVRSKDEPLYGGRVVYDLMFYFIVIIIIMNLIFGVIIDTFADLRAEKNDTEDNMKNTCYVCGLSRTAFDSSSRAATFEQHTLTEHNVWDYVYFMTHLRIKDSTEFTGPESYVKRMLDERDNSWFPRMQAISLLQRDKHEDQADIRTLKGELHTTNNKLDDLTNELVSVQRTIKSQHTSMAREAQRRDANNRIATRRTTNSYYQ
ncbi:hypothetical protein SARC_05737 [Sphaeroforma arctica JP610]|uniref:Ion transport domain-containing protein n=1 Tax=Sphaeroforma arctica JP610 TaxID=667725 RepID=A0A0L0G190_9EUKA|nr:hypothetical protein SARC_05737 [Sphaeroforma arctica JP610]KNC81973.1 hypothetical protein SARC_05737 [Sphaeroforma arctica JP610]|eukprot:XP_014155875.1 hypothetical protein SARC_05737 [Sphaeroforma arctica JP610]